MKRLIAILVVIAFMALASSGMATDVRDKMKYYGTNTHNGAETFKNIGFSIYSKAIDVATWAVSAAEHLYSMWIVSSGSTGTNTVTVTGGYTGRLLIVRNATGGDVVVKESGQTGVTIATGKTAIIMHNGTDYIRITGDATH